MLTSQTKKFSRLVIILGVIGIGSLFFLSDPKVEAQDDNIFPLPLNNNNVGVLTGDARTQSIIGVVNHKDDIGGEKLFVFWKGATNQDVHYSDFFHGNWSAISNFTHDNPSIISGYGVNAVATDSQLCLFLKGEHASKKEGQIYSTCNAITYDINSQPVIQNTWSPITHFKDSSLVDSMTSSRTSLINPSKFSVTLSHERGSWGEYRIDAWNNCNFDNNLNDISCKKTAYTAPKFTIHKGPSLAVIPTAFDDDQNPITEVTYVFFRDAWDSQGNRRPNAVAYLNATNGIDTADKVFLEDGSDTPKRFTQHRVDSYYFDNHIFVAYKNEDGGHIGYSQIERDVFLSDNASKRWIHFDTNVMSDTGPSFFEYNNTLYVLYSDMNNNNKISYLKIAEVGGPSITPPTIPGATTESVPSTFINNNTLFAVWKGLTNKFVYLSYEQEDGTWSAPVTLKDNTGKDILSGFGVEATTLQSPNFPDPLACLFLKDPNQGEDDGFINYTCSPIINNTDQPSFSWSPLTKFAPAVSTEISINYDKTDAIVSAKAFGDTLYILSSSYSPKEGHTSLYNFHCPLSRISGSNYSLNGACQLTLSNVDYRKAKGGSIMELSSGVHYLFFRHPGENERLYYLSDDPAFANYSSSPLLDNAGKYYATKTRTVSHYLNNTAYVAYTNKDNEVSFAKAPGANLLISNNGNGELGFKAWQNCRLPYKSPTGPALYERNGGLYILFADQNNSDTLTYFRIDNMDFKNCIE